MRVSEARDLVIELMHVDLTIGENGCRCRSDIAGPERDPGKFVLDRNFARLSVTQLPC